MVLGRSIERAAFERTMNTGIHPIETDDDVQRALVSALSDEQIDDLMHKTLAEDKHATQGTNAGVLVTIAKCNIMGLNAEKCARFYAESTQAEVQTKSRTPTPTCSNLSTMFH